MKLLFCKKCNDVFKLQYEYRSCQCGKVRGKYIDNLNAITEGEDYEILGLNNASLKDALSLIQSERISEIKREMGIRFEAFIIPDSAPSVWRRK
jgi:hypothetical protein